MSGEIKEFKIFYRSEIYVNAETQEQAEDILRGYDEKTLSERSSFFDIESTEETGVTLEKTVEDDEVEKLLMAFEIIENNDYLDDLFRKEYATDYNIIKHLIVDKTIKRSAKEYIYKLVKMLKI